MDKMDLQYFLEGIRYIRDEFYLDAIRKFRMLIEEFPRSDLADDALYNIGLCYFKMKQYRSAIEIFEEVVSIYPEATISENIDCEIGMTAAKSLYSMILSYLALGQNEEAVLVKSRLIKYSEDSYVIYNNVKISFFELADLVLQGPEKK